MSQAGAWTVCGLTETPSFLTLEDLRLADVDPCCMGTVMSGAAGCTCWVPTYDLVQELPRPGEDATRRQRCHDCAFRPDSPERARGDELEGLDNFHCHQGVRRVVEWRHPDGRVRPGDPADYHPLLINGHGYKADGSPMDICAGWAQSQRLLARDVA